MTTAQLQNKISRMWADISEEVGSSTLDTIRELVELEIQLERECNK